jgi:TonB family protein
MALIMAQDRTSRGVATLAALGVQGLVLLALGVGLGIVPVSQPESPAMAVALVPQLRPIVDSPASTPRAHVHLQDPGTPPVIPTDIILPTVPDPPPDAEAPRTTRNESMGSGGSDSGISILSRVEPDYPRAAVERRAQGTTSVAFLVDANGHPGTVRVLHGSGDPQLDEAAVRAVQKWEFSAATSNAHVVPRWGRLDINFNLTTYYKEHVGTAAATRSKPDPVVMLTAVIRSSSADSALRDTIRQLLQKSGPVRSIRFIGVSARPPQGTTQEVPQELRTLDSSHVEGWDVFEVTQTRGTSQWYCAVDATGQIQAIVANAD